MTKSKLLLSSLLIALPLISSTAYANPAIGCRGGIYVELEPFIVRVNDDWSKFHYARTFCSLDDNCHDAYCLDDNKWQFAYHVALGYDFLSCSPCYYWGASLEYTHFDLDEHDRTRRGTDLFSTLGTFNFGSFTDASARIDTNYHAVDLLAHYHLAVNCIQTQIFGGVRYAKFDEQLSVDYHFEPLGIFDLGIPRDFRTAIDREFEGVGPFIGVGATLPVYCGLGLKGDVAGSFLRADRQSHANDRFLATLAGDTVFGSEFPHRNSNHDWVTGVTAHLGLAYSMMFCNCSSLGLEAGYRYDRYFNAFNTITFFNTCGDDCNRIAGHHNDDFTFHGPYLRLSWHL